mgnify:CR=1 FL=1
MARVKIKDSQTGQILEVDESELGNYGLSSPSAAPQTPSGSSSKYITGYSPEEHQQALQAARGAGDTAAIKQITADYDTEFGYQKEIGTFKEKEGKSDEQKKEERKLDKAENIVKVLEDTYFRGGQTTGLAFGQYGLGGRLGGTQKELQRKYAPTKESEQLNTYKRTLESKRALLAKAAGDAGNLALQEQILAGKGLPDENSTPEEAFALFKTMRESFNFAPRQRLQTIEGNYKSKQQPLTAQVQQQPQQQQPQQTGNILQQILPSLIPGVAGFNNPLQPNALQKFINPNISRASEQMMQGQLPSKEQVPGIGFDLATTLAGGGSLKFLSRGKNILSGAAKTQAAVTRNKIAEEVTKKLPVKPLIDEAERIAKNLPATANKAKEEIEGLGKNINARNLVEKIDFWGQAFKNSGELKDTASAKLYGTLQRTAKKVLEDKAPEVLKAHKKLQREAVLKSGIPNALKKILFYGGPTIGILGGAAYLGNILRGNQNR